MQDKTPSSLTISFIVGLSLLSYARQDRKQHPENSWGAAHPLFGFSDFRLLVLRPSLSTDTAMSAVGSPQAEEISSRHVGLTLNKEERSTHPHHIFSGSCRVLGADDVFQHHVYLLSLRCRENYLSRPLPCGLVYPAIAPRPMGSVQSTGGSWLSGMTHSECSKTAVYLGVWLKRSLMGV